MLPQGLSEIGSLTRVRYESMNSRVSDFSNGSIDLEVKKERKKITSKSRNKPFKMPIISWSV